MKVLKVGCKDVKVESVLLPFIGEEPLVGANIVDGAGSDVSVIGL